MNHIPRSAKKLDVTLLTNTNVGAVHLTCYKEPGGWIGVSGKRWGMFISHLRNDQFCKLEVIG
jgi:hypothetical protein